MEFEYPYTDERGTTWINSNTFMGSHPEPCFICHKPTYRIDLCFEGHFCGEEGCWTAAAEDLKEHG